MKKTGPLLDQEPPDDQPKGCILACWVLPDDTPDWFVTLFDALRRLNLGVLWDRSWIDIASGDLFKRNHLACIIRREYMTIFPDDTPRIAMDRSREFMENCERGAADFLRRGTWKTKSEIEVSNEYLPN